MATYVLIVGGKENPSLEDIEPREKPVSFSYETDFTASRALRIPTRGKLEFRVTAKTDSLVLLQAFDLCGENDEQRLVMRGTYYPRGNIGRLLVGRKAG